jgi:hypothetical protein
MRTTKSACCALARRKGEVGGLSWPGEPRDKDDVSYKVDGVR